MAAPELVASSHETVEPAIAFERFAVRTPAGDAGGAVLCPAIILRQLVEQRIEPVMAIILELAMLAMLEGFAQLRLAVAIEEEIAGIDLRDRVQPLHLFCAEPQRDEARLGSVGYCIGDI